MNNQLAISELAPILEINVIATDYALNRRLLAEKITELINHDFNRLIAILYRLDVSENRLKDMLAENKDQDAGFTIADLMIERQIKKIEARKNFKKDNDIREEDSWE